MDKKTLEDVSNESSNSLIDKMLSVENSKPSSAIVEFGELTPEEYSVAVAMLESENQESLRKIPHARLDKSTGKVTYNPKTFKVMSLPEQAMFKLAKWEDGDNTHYIADYDTLQSIFKYGDIKVNVVQGYTVSKDKKKVISAQFKKDDALSNFVLVGSLKDAKEIHALIKAKVKKTNNDIDLNFDF